MRKNRASTPKAAPTTMPVLACMPPTALTVAGTLVWLEERGSTSTVVDEKSGTGGTVVVVDRTGCVAVVVAAVAADVVFADVVLWSLVVVVESVLADVVADGGCELVSSMRGTVS